MPIYGPIVDNDCWIELFFITKWLRVKRNNGNDKALSWPSMARINKVKLNTK